MSLEQWTEVDNYLSGMLLPADPTLDAALKASTDAGLPAISVTAHQGKFLHLIARALGARRILELGTLGGYSTIWLARALPADGKLISLEFDPKHAAVARENIARAKLEQLVEVRVGPALQTLPVLASENPAPFDLIFIDADKENYAGYFEWAMKLSRPGTVIIADNVVRNGAVVDAASKDVNVRGVRRFLEMVANEPRVSTTAIQTVGSKGYDGFALVLVNQPGQPVR